MAEEILSTTLHHLVGAVRCIGVLIQPFLPEASRAILAASGSSLDRANGPKWLDGLSGTAVTKPVALFPRLTA
jgi:methionyl-tRNA synthetase